MSNFRNSFYAVATIAGTIIGVGFFSLPYIASKVGILVMLGYFVILGGIVILIHLIFGELSLKTPDFKRLPGFAKFYLGDRYAKIALSSAILGLFGSILAYLIVGGQFLGELFSPIFGGGNFLYTFLYFAAGALLIYFGIKIISKIEFLGVILLLIIIFIIYFKGRPLIHFENLIFFPINRKLGIGDLFLPYGPILFSLWGAALVPEVEEMLEKRKKSLKTIILISTLIPILVYIFFVYLILGISGQATTEFALTGLKQFFKTEIFSLGLIFGIIASFTSFIAIGLTLKNILSYDFKINEKISWLISCFIPLILFLLGFKNFIQVISVIGGVMLGVDGILILLIYQKMGGHKKLVFPLILIFLGGIIYEIVRFVI